MLQKYAIFLLFVLVSCEKTIKFQPIIIVPDVKIFFGPPSPSTSKFPPIIELLVQRLQSQFSTYVYEDLSRPATYEKPVYTLSPEEQATATEPLVLAESVTTKYDESNNTEKLQEQEQEQNAVHPIHYGTLVVYLKKNSTVKTDDVIPKTQQKPSPILDINVVIST